jgi:glycosyltransferase involved in cell wall biosynthesis
MNPSVTTIICTVDRPELLREAINSIRSQEGAAGTEIIVVFDQTDPDLSLVDDGSTDGVVVRVVANDHRPGLAGGRNTGIDAARGTYIAFCDDDDYWLPGKLGAQLAAFDEHPEAILVATGVVIEHQSRRHERVWPRNEVVLRDLTRNRLVELPSSGFMYRADELRAQIGPVNEDVPGGFGEDYDLLLRTARLGPIVNIPEPLVVVRWLGSSYFFQRWQTMSEALIYLLDQFPELHTDRRGLARLQGQLSFARAAAGDRSGAWRHGLAALRAFPLEPRPALAALVAVGLDPNRVMALLHRVGRGI